MKKRAVFGFSLFLVVGYLYLDKAFSSNHYYINTTEDFVELADKTNIDVIFMGSSHAYTAYNPIIINDQCNTISFNLGSDSLLMSLTDLLLTEAFKYTNPKLIVIEAYIGSLFVKYTEEVKGHQLRALDFVSNLSPMKFTKTRKLFSNDEFIGVYSPLVRNHASWSGVSFTNLSKRRVLDDNNVFFNSGYLGALTVITEEVKTNYLNFRDKNITKDSSVVRIKGKTKNEIASVINVAKNAGIDVLVVTSPDLRAKYSNYFFFDELRSVCDSLEVNYLNLNDHYADFNLTTDDFKDSNHLNLYGGTKVSKFLGGYINKNYDLPKRNLDEAWQQSKLAYDGFMNQYYNTGDGTYSLDDDFIFLNEIESSQLSIVKSGNEFVITLNLDVSKKSKKGNKGFAFEFQIHPRDNEQNLLSEKSKSRKWKFERGATPLMDNQSIITCKITSNIEHIKEVRIFLYKQGEKGIKGESLLINNVIFN